MEIKLTSNPSIQFRRVRTEGFSADEEEDLPPLRIRLGIDSRFSFSPKSLPRPIWRDQKVSGVQQVFSSAVLGPFPIPLGLS